MRAIALGSFLSVVVLVPIVGNAQVYRLPTPPPQVTAASADWLVQGEPILYSGSFYYPSGPVAFFDQWMMARVGTYKGVPLYEDSTLEPDSIVYVPVGGNKMRPYERRRDGALAGTVGNRLPSFPIERDGEVSVAAGGSGTTEQPPATSAPIPPVQPMELLETERADKPVSTSGSRPNVVESIPPPESSRGIWITFDGVRWYGAGAAVPFDRTRFVAVGEYHGFPVYRDKDHADEIFVPATKGGPLTPYRR
jgi:hypothetical protein